MITRTAIFEGRIKPGFEQRFMQEVRERLAPIWVRFPHAHNVRLLPATAVDAEAPPIATLPHP